MAGFDFELSVAPEREDLARALLRTAQQHARDLGLRFQYQREPDGFYCTLDGRLPVMHAYEADVSSPLRAVASVFPGPGDRRQRTAVASRLLSALRTGLADMTESVREVADTMQEHGLGAVPHSIAFDVGSRTHLRSSLDALTRTLALDIAGRVEKRTVIEDTHTAVEHVLRAYLGKGTNTLSFEGMVRAAGADGTLSDEDVRNLLELKDLRRESRHRGQGFDETRAGELVAEAVSSIHKLLARLRRR